MIKARRSNDGNSSVYNANVKIRRPVRGECRIRNV